MSTCARANALLFLCLRSRWDPSALPAARSLVDKLDLAGLLQTAQIEGVAPLLYSVVRGQYLVPPAAEESLRQAYYASAAHNVPLLHELEAVLRALRAEQIPCIVLKGAALGPAVYGNPAVRPLGDLDLLVHDTDVPAAQHLLATRGYVPTQSEARPNALFDHENERILYRPGPREAALEIHWSLLDSPYYQHYLPMEWFWQTARSLTIGKTPALMLGPEAQVIYLCAHLVLHHGGADLRLLWLHDIAEVIVYYEQRLDWDVMLTQAQACDLVLPVQQLLPHLARDWQVPIPVKVLAQLEQMQPSHNEARVYAWLTSSNHSVGRRFWADLASTPGWRQRMRFAWANLFPAPAYMRQRYRIQHSLLLPLYYPYRWFLGLRSALAPGTR